MVIKICGVTRKEDALLAVDLGAWAVGFNFYEKSPRCVTVEQAASMAARLPLGVRRVGVFVNAGRSAIERTVVRAGLDMIQLHGDEPPDMCRNWPCEVIKAMPLSSGEDAERLAAYKVYLHLADSGTGDAYGGTGKLSDWKLAAEAAARHRLLLAGGLTPENVAEAVRAVRPFGVDVASGVEREPGVKDASKMKAFFTAAREAAKETKS
ncbi:MAG: phosphoribosylanthranilate isomerase [Acidobacteriota bacterium]|nr:MAG: phosphoribosylanthranilate isomerase [Acidobacteriota bacterium]